MTNTQTFYRLSYNVVLVCINYIYRLYFVYYMVQISMVVYSSTK